MQKRAIILEDCPSGHQHLSDIPLKFGVDISYFLCYALDKMKKDNKQCLLDTPRTVRVSKKNLASYNSNQQTP